ncbi:hypothetical protein QE152_g25296 [Popillia japonica]|uniref:Uncharacterized protein n=1 Tax=Popillia japonica TaxID=7064 RepID=A0AAW1K393_POPJA
MSDETTDGDGKKYTVEQMIVSAVWVHERFYNNQTWKDIIRNFKYRFNVPPPAKGTLLKWENKLFTTGFVEKKQRSGRFLTRLMHVPYVKESLKENPSLSLRERARELGLSRSTLLKILQEDLNMVFEVDDNDNNPNKRYAMCNNGRWIKKQGKLESETHNIKEEPSTSKDNENENDAKEPEMDDIFSDGNDGESDHI